MQYDFRRKVGAVAVSIFLLLFMAAAANAQVLHGTLTGTVTDQSGAVMPGVKVTAVDNATGKAFTTTTDSTGSYSISGMPYGNYKVTYEAEGFAKSTADAKIEVGQIAKISPKLQVAAVGTEVVVQADQSAVQTTTSELKASVDRRQILELPLPTRNPLDLVRTMAGIAAPTSSGIADVFVNGLRGNSTNLTQDGINMADNFVKTSGFFSISAPTVDAVGEFSVSIAGQGRDSGFGAAQVAMTTQRGSNNFHGSIFWFQRTNALNANTFFNNSNNVARPFQLQNRIGFNMRAPAYIPGIYDGRNKTWWFFNYEAFREPLSRSRTRTVLSPAARTGSYSWVVTCTAATCPVGITPGQVNTINLITSGIGTIGNTGLTPAIHPLLMSVYNANVPSTGLSTQGCTNDTFNILCFTFNLPGSSKQDRYNLRVDHQFNNSHAVEFTFSQANFASIPDLLNGIEPAFLGGLGGGQTSVRHLAAWAWHSTWGANKTNELRWGFQRAPVLFDLFERYGEFGTTGWIVSYGATFSPIHLPGFSLPQGRNTPVRQLIDNFAWVRGKHTFRFGGEFRQVVARSFAFQFIRPRVNLGSNTANPNGITASDFPGGISSGDLGRASAIFNQLTGLLGSTQNAFNHTSPTSGFVPGAPQETFPIQNSYSLYFQDSFKFRPNLTVNYGVRWETQGVFDQRNALTLLPSEADFWGPSQINTLHSPCTGGGCSSSGITNPVLNFAGSRNGAPLYNRDWNDFGPFLGFAWDPFSDGKTAVRGGFGVSYTQEGFTLFNAPSTGNLGLFSSLAETLPTGIFDPNAVPLPATPTASFPRSQRTNFIGNVNSNFWFINPNIRTPYILEWNLAVQRETWNRITFEARYVGNHAVKLVRTSDINQLNLLNSPFTSGVGSVSSILQEFLNAQSNLAISRANGGGNNFRNQGFGGQVPLPIFSAVFGSTTSSFFGLAQFINNLDQNQIGAMFDTIRRSNSFLANREANLPLNFFAANPYANLLLRMSNDSWSYYHGLQLEARRRFTSGLFFQANYTFSKVLTDARFLTSQQEFQVHRDLTNPRLDKNRAAFDITHTFSANYLYPLPFGRGQLIGRDVSPIVDKFIGGWQIQGLTRLQTGSPFTISSGRLTTAAVIGETAVLRNMSIDEMRRFIGIFKTDNGVFWLDPNSGLINPTTGAAVLCTAGQTTPCWDHPGVNEFGTLPFIGFDGPYFWNQDLSVIKRTSFPSISERFNFEIRFEAFNFFNHPNFSVPGGGITAGNFGKLTGQVDTVRGGGVTSRIIQWGIRLNW
jgi:hypothetical protein